MSHFKVAVITYEKKTVEELLAPYQENNMQDVPRKFLKFYDYAESLREEYEHGTLDFVYHDGKLITKFDDTFKKTVKGIMGFNRTVYEVPEGSREVKVSIKDLYPTIEEYIREYECCADVDDETGKYGYWENPNAKWDYWTELDERGTWLDEYMGGNGLRICDLEFDSDFQRAKEAEWWRQNVEVEDKPGVDTLLNHFHTNGMAKDKFIEASGHLWFRAVVTPDGQWHEVGKMGWWGMSDETADDVYEWAISFEDRFIRPLNPNCRIHVVDCHV
jgi:hypothetical protein